MSQTFHGKAARPHTVYHLGIVNIYALLVTSKQGGRRILRSKRGIPLRTLLTAFILAVDFNYALSFVDSSVGYSSALGMML
jgi:hypothetical protein